MVFEKRIDRLLETIDQDELYGLTADLVRTNSVWDPAAGTGERSVAKMVAQSGASFDDIDFDDWANVVAGNAPLLRKKEDP